MRIEKAELARKIDKLKSVVPKNGTMQGLMGILLQDGYLTASNTEMTIKAQIEGAEGESLIIPLKAFELIKNLPDGEVDVTSNGKNVVTIKMDKIKNSYQSLPVDEFAYSTSKPAEGGGSVSIQGKLLRESMSRVLYAVSESSGKKAMTALCLHATGGRLNFVGLDGYVIAWDRQEFEGEFQLLVPRNAVEKLISLDIGGEVTIEYNKNSAIFRTEEYEVSTRLIEGDYFAYQKMFGEQPMRTSVNRLEMLDAMTRAKLCADEDRLPAKFDIRGGSIELGIKGKLSDYHEKIKLQETMDDLEIAFVPKRVIKTLRAFSSQEVSLHFNNDKTPMIVRDGGADMQALVLPFDLNKV